MRQTFSKDERLCSHIIIRRLFAGGLTFNLRPFRVTWLLQPLDLPSPVQVLISVPKYNFRKAVHRNLIRRRIKEAYRMNKHLIYNSFILTKYLLKLNNRIDYFLAIFLLYFTQIIFTLELLGIFSRLTLVNVLSK